jgi:hypothetical protein
MLTGRASGLALQKIAPSGRAAATLAYRPSDALKMPRAMASHPVASASSTAGSAASPSRTPRVSATDSAWISPASRAVASAVASALSASSSRWPRTVSVNTNVAGSTTRSTGITRRARRLENGIGASGVVPRSRAGL